MNKTPNAFVSASFTTIALRERFKRQNRVEKKEISFESPRELHLPIYLNGVIQESDLVEKSHTFWENVPAPAQTNEQQDSPPWS